MKKRANVAAKSKDDEEEDLCSTAEVPGVCKLRIAPPNFQTVVFELIGTAPYVQNKFSDKARAQMKEKQEAGSQAKKGKLRSAKNFDACYKSAIHRAKDANGKEWFGIPAPAFRCALISACRTVDFKMTLAKLSLFAEADGVDSGDGTPLVRFTKGTPHPFEAAVRLETGVCDIRIRPMWDIGWRAKLRLRFDGDQFSLEDVTNLLMRAGQQVGIGEGRPDSKKSAGMGWGLFSISEQ